MSDGNEAVLSVAVRDHQLAWFRPTPPLRGLDAALDRQEAEVLRTTGYDLMTLGIPGDEAQGAAFSKTMYIRKI